MAAVTDRTIRPGQATPEAQWLHWPALREAPVIAADELVPPGARAVVVAPHPDDEVLAAGGLMRQLLQQGRSLCVVAVTDGEASPPGSTPCPAARLAPQRAQEQREALRPLGATDAVQVHRLGFPDGGLQARRAALQDALHAVLRPGDVLVTTWRLDGHPDHEAVGEASADAALRRGARQVEVPVWGWHWSRPSDTPMPWTRARRLLLDDSDVAAKGRALEAFQTQLQGDPSTGAGPILDDASRARARRAFELLFV